MIWLRFSYGVLLQWAISIEKEKADDMGMPKGSKEPDFKADDLDDKSSFQRAAARLKDLGATADGAARILNEFGKAAAASYWPTPKEIAIMRMDVIRKKFGHMRFFIPGWWRWWFFSKKY